MRYPPPSKAWFVHNGNYCATEAHIKVFKADIKELRKAWSKSHQTAKKRAKWLANRLGGNRDCCEITMPTKKGG